MCEYFSKIPLDLNKKALRSDLIEGVYASI